MMNELFKTAAYFKDEEKLFAFSLLANAFSKLSKKTEAQKEFIARVGEYLSVFEPQTEIEFEKLDNVENEELQMFILGLVYELLYLEDKKFEFEDNDKVLAVIDCFSLKRSFIKKMKQNLLDADEMLNELKVLINEKATVITKEQLKSEVSKYVSLKITADKFSSLPSFKTKRDFEELFALECRKTTNKYYEINTEKMIEIYLKSLENINSYIIETYVGDAENKVEEYLKDFKEISWSESKNHEYEIDFDAYKEYSVKSGSLDMNKKWFAESTIWVLNMGNSEILSQKIYDLMLDIENKVYERYQNMVEDILEYYTSNYTLIRQMGADTPVDLVKILQNENDFMKKIEIMEQIQSKFDKAKFRELLETEYINKSTIIENSIEHEFIGYTKGYILFIVTYKNDDAFITRNTLSKIISMDLMKNISIQIEMEQTDNDSLTSSGSINTEDKLYFLLTVSSLSQDNCTFLVEFNNEEHACKNVEINHERVLFFDDMHVIEGERFIYEKYGDVFIGYKDIMGNVQKEMVIEGLCNHDIDSAKKNFEKACLTDDVLIDKFLNLEDGLVDILKSEVENENGMAMYLLGELYFHDNRLIRGRQGDVANELWERGRKINCQCRARDLINNRARYSEEEVEEIIGQMKAEHPLNNYLYGLLCMNNWVKDNHKSIRNIFEEDLKKDNANWIVYYSLGLRYLDDEEGTKDILLARKYFKQSVKKGIYDSIDKLMDTYFANGVLTEEEYEDLKDSVNLCETVLEIEEKKNELGNVEDLIPKIHLCELDRDSSSYYMDTLKKFSSKSAAKSYAEKQYEKYCGYIKDTFRLNCYYYSGENGSFRNFISQNIDIFKGIIKKIYIVRCAEDRPYCNVNLKEHIATISDKIIAIGQSIKVDNFYAENYLVHDFTDWGDGGFFSKKEYSDFPSTGNLSRDFNNRKEEFSQLVRKELISYIEEMVHTLLI